MKTQYYETVSKGGNANNAAIEIHAQIGARLGKCTTEEAARHFQMLKLIDEIEEDKKETAGKEQLEKITAKHAAHFSAKDQVGFVVEDGVVHQKDCKVIVINRINTF